MGSKMVSKGKRERRKDGRKKKWYRSKWVEKMVSKGRKEERKKGRKEERKKGRKKE